MYPDVIGFFDDLQEKWNDLEGRVAIQGGQDRDPRRLREVAKACKMRKSLEGMNGSVLCIAIRTDCRAFCWRKSPFKWANLQITV